MNVPTRSQVKLEVLLVIVFVSCQVHPQEIKTCTCAEADSLSRLDTTIVLLDVRTKGEFDGELGHLKGAILIPVQELEKRIDELKPFRARRIIAYCHSGRRSATATTLLLSKGYDAVNMEGGIVRWDAEKRPVVKEQPGHNQTTK